MVNAEYFEVLYDLLYCENRSYNLAHCCHFRDIQTQFVYRCDTGFGTVDIGIGHVMALYRYQRYFQGHYLIAEYILAGVTIVGIVYHIADIAQAGGAFLSGNDNCYMSDHILLLVNGDDTAVF